MVKCQNCGAQIANTLAFCPVCGMQQLNVQTEPETKEARERRERRPLWIAAGVFAALAVVVLLLAFLFSRTPSGAPPLTTIAQTYEFTITDEGADEAPILMTTYDLVTCDDNRYPRLKQALEAFNEAQYARMEESVFSFGQMLYQLYLYSERFSFATDETRLSVERADAKVVSMVMENVVDYEGAGRYTQYFSTTIDTATGETIPLSAIAVNANDLADAIYEALRDAYPDAYARETMRDDILSYLNQDILAWTLSYDGLRVWFSDYMFGDYESGHGDAIVYFAAHEGLFIDDYTTADARVAPDVTARGEETIRYDLDAFCWERADYMIANFEPIEGDWISENGARLAVSKWGVYTLYNETGNALSFGSLRANPDNVELWDDDAVYGTFTFENENTIVLNTKLIEDLSLSR